jgi:hypothetical protein
VPNQKFILKSFAVQLEKQLRLLEPISRDPQFIGRIKCLLLQDSSLLLFALCHISKPLLVFFEQHFVNEVEMIEVEKDFG